MSTLENLTLEIEALGQEIKGKEAAALKLLKDREVVIPAKLCGRHKLGDQDRPARIKGVRVDLRLWVTRRDEQGYSKFVDTKAGLRVLLEIPRKDGNGLIWGDASRTYFRLDELELQAL